MFTTPWSNILKAEVGSAVIQGANCYARYVQHINYFQKLSQAWWRQLKHIYNPRILHYLQLWSLFVMFPNFSDMQAIVGVDLITAKENETFLRQFAKRKRKEFQ